MILTEASIQKVRDLSPTEVIGHYVKLNSRGGGLCPFHSEKTPSFHVSESKGIFKCFGCGEAGDQIAFVMKHDKVDFIEAIGIIAGLCHITLEYEEVPDKEKYEQQKALRDELKETLTYTITRYRNNLWALPADHPVMMYLQQRNITKEIILEWQLGWSTEDWQHISTDLINKNKFSPANKLGIILRSRNGEKNYDGYRSRLTIPITNRHGEYIGLAGRFLEIDPNDANKNYPKYINPPENDLYNKSTVLFGLSRADKSISQNGYAFLVEGYFDVISMHVNNDKNTVGTCGTALTIDQATLLKKYTNHVAVLRDGDEAGRKATVKDLQTFLRAGFKVDVVLLPDKEDPDSYTQKLISNHYVAGKLEIHDAVFWYIENLLKYVSHDEFKLGKAQEAVMHLLTTIPNDIIRNNYFDSITKKYKWPRQQLQKQLINLVDEKLEKEIEDDGEGRALDKLAKWMNRDEFENNGYCTVRNNVRTGYYTHNGDKHVEITNFVITPLFHIYAGKESRHLILIDNGKRKAVLDIESKALVTPDLLQQYVVSEGPYIIYGSKAQILRIATTLLANFPRCIEVKFLGWQTPGFFAFVDNIFVPGEGLRELDEWGIYKHADNNYLVPAASAAYRELQTTGDDPYENDRYLKFAQSRINFSQWASLIHRVYKEKGPVGIAYVILTAFRDIVFEVDNNCPHLYGFGERTSGKSKWAESITAVFYTKRPAFNLNSGTDFAFFSYMQRFINCPSSLNEFDEKVIKPEWFQAIKGIFDGEGRQRGVMGSRNRTEIMKIRSTLILMGQFLCTMDDNSIVSRSIIEGFNEREWSDDDKKEYDKLKHLEESGISSLVLDLLLYRKDFKSLYRDRFNETLGEWRRSIDGDTQSFNQRIMQNWCHLYTGWKIISEKIKLPMDDQAFEKYCKTRALHWSAFIRSSDTLSEFWNTLSFLVDMGVIVEGWDFKIESVIEVKIRKDRKEEFTQSFPEPTKIIHIRMNNVHKHYQQAFRNRTGKEGMTLDNLLHYFSSRKYFIGSSKQSRFKRFVTKTENVSMPGFMGATTNATRPDTKKVEEVLITSSYVFLYDQLNLDLERVIPDEEAEIITYSNGISKNESAPVGDLPF